MSREEIINLSNNIRTGKDYETLLNYFKGLNERISPQKHTIVFSLPSFTGTGYFRVSEPLFSIFRATDEFNLVYTDKIMPIHINIADLLVLHRAGDMHDLTHSIINAYPSHKIKPLIIHNVDDDESNLAKSHNMRDMWLHAGRDKQAVRAMRMSDAVEITGRRLKQIASQRNKNSFITPNYFNWRNPQWNMPKKKNLSESFPETDRLEHFTIPSEWQNKCVVGWAGLTSHYEDLKKIAPILKAIHDKYPNTVFAICGMALKDTSFRIEVDPKTGEKTTVEETNVPKESTYRYRVSKLFEGIAEDRIKIFDALHLENYAWFYSIMDIGIVLVEHNIFNQAKSSIKFNESIMYNVPTVCSYFGGYTDTFDILKQEATIDKDVLNKMICKTECDKSEWVKNLSYFVENYNNEDVKEKIQTIKSFIQDYYDIDLHVHEKIGKYKNMIEENIDKYQYYHMKLKTL